MGNFLDKPITEEVGHDGAFSCGKDSLEYAMSSIQGWRTSMEDAHFYHEYLPESEEFKVPAIRDVSFFGVFDGHGGNYTARYSAENLLKVVQSCEEYKDLPKGNKAEILKVCLEKAFPKLDEDMRALPQFVEKYDRSGSTAIVAFITPDSIVFANVGDSRAILVRNNLVHFFTRDHKPYDPDEERRILKAGGHVAMNRVNGDLAVSRALGDFTYKINPTVLAANQQVSASPDVTIISRDDENDQFLLLACDGIWDVMSNEQVCAFVLSKMELGYGLRDTCRALVNACIRSRDNISVLLIALPGAPKSIGTLKPEDIPTNDLAIVNNIEPNHEASAVH